MPASDSLTPLIRAIGALDRWCSAERVPYVLIGGVAASLLGRPRLTRDVDAALLLAGERWQPFLAAGAAFGMEPRLPDAVDFARRSRVLLVRHAESSIDVDLAFAALPFEEEMIARSVRVQLAPGLEVPLPEPEDLVIMKAVAHRARDRGDIEGLLASHPDLDLAHVRARVAEFADALGEPQILADLEQILNPPRRG